jgi:methylenetetrahydrofolate dehydrogenase (NADP+)/methenyltetrahydrofolate cyclohydrolase
MISLRAKPVLEIRRNALRERVAARVASGHRPPKLCVILVGDHPASQIYVSRKEKMAGLVGFERETLRFPESTTPDEVRLRVAALNEDPSVDGILIQRPLPSAFDEKEVCLWVHPEKDVDCLHPENMGLLLTGNPRFLPCTPGGILLLLEHYGLELAGKTACVIGRSLIVGKPLAALLLSRNASVIQIHRQTPDTATLCKLADFVFVAAGSQGLLKRDWIKPGAVVVDVGIHRLPDGRITGDVDTESLGETPSALTPVPGGVGPMTIQVLLENTFTSSIRKS